MTTVSPAVESLVKRLSENHREILAVVARVEEIDRQLGACSWLEWVQLRVERASLVRRIKELLYRRALLESLIEPSPRSHSPNPDDVDWPEERLLRQRNVARDQVIQRATAHRGG
jgi:hypothetical protein